MGEAPAGSGSLSALKRDVVIATRLLNAEGILGYSGHLGARIPGTETFLVQPRDTSRSDLEPADLLVCDFDGKVVEGKSRPPSEVFIHSEIFKARPDVNAIFHFHHDLTNVFTLVEDVPLVPFKNHAVRWASGIPVYPDPSHVHSAEHGRDIASTLGPHHAMQIRAHGQIVTAEDPRSVFIDAVHLVENAQAAYHAAAIGKVKPLTEADIAKFNTGVRRDHHINKLWTYYVGRAEKDGLIPESCRG